MRVLVGIAAGSVLVAVVTVLGRDPEDPWSVATFVGALGVAAGALLTVAQLRMAGRRGARARATRAVAIRRGSELGTIVALLLWLRALDGLSPLTAAFVVGTFVVAELVLSARPLSSR